jgi:hypothetical protein
LAPILAKGCLIAATLGQPFVLSRILSFISDQNQSENVGYCLIGAIGLIYFLIALFRTQYDHALNTFMMETRNIAVTAIYSKTFEVDLGELSNGATSTLINVDVELIMNGFRSLHEIWASIVMLALSMWLVYNELSYA